MGKTGISWCDEVWNPVVGCSAACDYCYARELHDRRYLARLNGWSTAPAQYLFPFSQVQLFPERLTIPLKRKKPTTFFVNSVSDLFDAGVPDDFLDQVYAVMALCPQHTFLVLTKRAKEMAGYHVYDGSRPRVRGAELPNVWHGVSAENQQTADERIPHLLRVPGKRFLSIEPMLGPVDLDRVYLSTDHARWVEGVILGGESGKTARSMHPNWVRMIRDQCEGARVPFFFKQWGEWIETPSVFDAPCYVNNYPLATIGMKSFSRVGKRKAGRTLDGVLHDALPWGVAK